LEKLKFDSSKAKKFLEVKCLHAIFGRLDDDAEQFVVVHGLFALQILAIVIHLIATSGLSPHPGGEYIVINQH